MDLKISQLPIASSVNTTDKIVVDQMINNVLTTKSATVAQLITESALNQTDTLNYASMVNVVTNGCNPPDGIINFTSILQALINSTEQVGNKFYGKALYFPAGTYKYTNLTYQNPLTFIGENPLNTILMPQPSANTASISAAVPTGSTTITPTSITNVGGDVTVHFSALASAPTVGSNVRISGVTPVNYNCASNITSSTTTSLTYPGPGTDAVTILGQTIVFPITYEPLGIQFKNLQVDLGNSPTVNHSSFFQSQQYLANRSGLVDNCWFFNCSGDVFDISDSFNWNFSNNRFESIGDYAAQTGGACRFRAVSWNSDGFVASNGNTFSNNYFNNCWFDLYSTDNNNNGNDNINTNNFYNNIHEFHNEGVRLGTQSYGNSFFGDYWEAGGNGVDNNNVPGLGVNAWAIRGLQGIIYGGFRAGGWSGAGQNRVLFNSTWTQDIDNYDGLYSQVFALGYGAFTNFSVDKYTGNVLTLDGNITATNGIITGNSIVGVSDVTATGYLIGNNGTVIAQGASNVQFQLSSSTVNQTYLFAYNADGTCGIYDTTGAAWRIAVTDVTGNVNIPTVINSTSPYSGSLTVDGGVGILGALNVGGAVSMPSLIVSGELRANKIGEAALSVDAGSENNAFGDLTLTANTSGYANTAIGAQALIANTTGYFNIGLGPYVLQNNLTGIKNVAIGKSSLSLAVSSNNTGVGTDSLGSVTTGSNNVGIGLEAGNDPVVYLTTQSNYVVIGNDSTANANIKVAWTVTSDARDKMNFTDVPHGLDFVTKLKPTSYQFKTKRDEFIPNGRVRYGFLAQDILELEGTNPVIIDNNDLNNLKYNETSMIPILVKAIQELKLEFEAYKVSHQ